MGESINFDLLSKQELAKLPKEDKIKAKEYFIEQKEYLENLKSGKDYQSQLDYDVHNDIKDYEERIRAVDVPEEIKK